MTAASDAELLAAVARRDADGLCRTAEAPSWPGLPGGVAHDAWRGCRRYRPGDVPQAVAEPGPGARGGGAQGLADAGCQQCGHRPGAEAKAVGAGRSAGVADGRARCREALERATAATAVDEAIAALPERQRLALSLVYFEGLTNIEAAAVMEASVEAVESLLSRARRALEAKPGWPMAGVAWQPCG